MKTFLKIMFSFFLVTQICFAQWYQQNPLPTGNNLNSVTFTDSNTGTMVGDYGTIIHTTDGGVTFTNQMSGTTYNLRAVSFTDTQNGWVVGGNWVDSLQTYIGNIILHTTDGGITWTPQTSGITNGLLGVSFPDLNNGIAVGYIGTILKTTNGGTTWTPQTSGTTNTLFDVSFTDAINGIAVGGSGTILKTTNGGTTWTSQTSGTAAELYAVSFPDTINGVVVGYNIMGGGGIICRTTNGGTAWTSQTNGITNALFDVSFTDLNNGSVISDGGGILRTTNGGTTWTSQIAPLSRTMLSGVSFYDLNNGIAVGSTGTILKTTDGGINWIRRSSENTGFMRGVSFSDANNGTAVVGEHIWFRKMGSSGLSRIQWGHIVRTTDGGKTWLTQTEAVPLLSAVCFTDANIGIAVGAGSEAPGIFRTTNGGALWTSEGMPEGIFSDVCFTDANTGTVVEGYEPWVGGRILHTNDGTTTWTTQWSDPNIGLSGVFFTDENTGTVVGRSGTILRTTNGGEVWTTQLSGTTNDLLDVHFIDANIGTAVGDSGIILHTTNGGALWTPQISGTTWLLNAVYFANNYSGTAVGSYRESDGTSSPYGIILHTNNGGDTWAAQSSGIPEPLLSISFIDEYNGWVVGKNGTILHTTNGGATFVEEEKIDEIPTTYSLSNNFPNPFNPSTQIKYSIPQSFQVVIKVFDVLGNEIEALVNEEKPAGTYELNWNAANLPSGVYFYRIQTSSFTQTRKMILLK
ncbi:MAG: T9SS type A sorting domain-containing protein [Ignavibacteriales bacterium]|nr:T9SS type A sorting domain-containing protein [Ignavibacteriales bacterium]